MEEHPVQQPIQAIDIDTIPEVQGSYRIGSNGVTRIEACQKSGLHANLPYVRVWAGDTCLAEFCQHNIVGVYFAPAEPEPAPSAEKIDWDMRDPDCADHDPAAGDKACRGCWIPF